ncbi:MAG TPA: hypothetical protein DCY27_13750 [Desulfobacterales bacterium]|nr:hypothetical protein [Desulfobacterales bacterium]
MNAPAAIRLAELLPYALCLPIAAIFRSNALVKRIRKTLRQGLPNDWRLLVADRAAPDKVPMEVQSELRRFK